MFLILMIVCAITYSLLITYNNAKLDKILLELIQEKQKQKFNKEISGKENELKNLEETLNDKTNEYSKIDKTIKSKEIISVNSLVNKVNMAKEFYKISKKKSEQIRIKETQMFFDKYITLNDETWDQIQEDINILLNGNLENKFKIYSNLTKNDKRLIILFLLKFPNPEICTILNLSRQALYARKISLFQHLGLHKEDGVEKCIEIFK